MTLNLIGNRISVRRDDDAQRRHLGALSILPLEAALKRGFHSTYVDEATGETRLDPLGVAFGVITGVSPRAARDSALAVGRVACFCPSHSCTQHGDEQIVDVDGGGILFTIYEGA